MKDFKALASNESIEKTVLALGSNGIEAFVVETGAEALVKAQQLIPEGAEVLTAASMTLDDIGVGKLVNESGKYDSIKSRFSKLDQKAQGREMRKLGAGPDYVLGSVHAVTETGSLLIASLTGSQLPAYANGAGNVVWIVSTKKIVKDVEEGFKRLEEHVVPRESRRARKAYGLPDSFNSYPSKVLVFNREIQPGRAKLIFVKEDLGF